MCLLCLFLLSLVVQLAKAMEYNDDFLKMQPSEGDNSATKDELGGKTDRYEWTQTESDVEIRIPLQAGTGKDAIKCKITSRGLDLNIRGGEVIQGEWFEPIVTDESAWQFGECLNDCPGGMSSCLACFVCSLAFCALVRASRNKRREEVLAHQPGEEGCEQLLAGGHSRRSRDQPSPESRRPRADERGPGSANASASGHVNRKMIVEFVLKTRSKASCNQYILDRENRCRVVV
jgi:hypothetical protein